MAAVDPNKAIRIGRFFSYPKQVLYLLASFIVLVSLCHFLSLASKYLRRHRTQHSTNLTRSFSYRRLPAALIDSARAIAFRYTIPLGSSYTLNLAEVALTAAYIAVLFGWTLANTTNLQGMHFDPKYYANRAGIIAASQIPIMTALGMRNNPISFLTGVSFDKLNYLHRLSARIICILGWIHGGGRITVGLLTDEAISHRWVQCGILAVSSLTLLCILTVRPVRARSYELFLVVHFLFAMIFLVGVFAHLTGRTLTYYGAWPSMILWGLDRLVRVVQLRLYNPTSAFRAALETSSDSTSSTTPSDTSEASKSEILTSAHLSLLTPTLLLVTLQRPDTWRSIHWRPGQSAYLSFPSLSSIAGGGKAESGLKRWTRKRGHILESHPFTILTLDGPGISPGQDAPGMPMKELTFLLRVRSGVTKRLADYAVSSFSASTTSQKSVINIDSGIVGGDTSPIDSNTSTPEMPHLPVILTGPYSSPPLLMGYDSVVLFAGGSGVAFGLPLFLDVIRRAKSNLPTAQRVRLVWAVRGSAPSQWLITILAPTLADLPSSLSVSVEVYNTSSTPSSFSSSSSLTDPEKWGDVQPSAVPTTPSTGPIPDAAHGEKTAAAVASASASTSSPDEGHKRILVANGRPDVGVILDAELRRAPTGGRVSVSVCGPRALSASVRHTLRRPRFMEVLRGDPTVVLHVEAFGGDI